jgi:solute carrier family 25 carnitine/acylcarnitine transporter 20/29
VSCKNNSGRKMTHNEKRSNWLREGLITTVTGIIFGATNTLTGHPFDTVKTKM